MKTLILFFSVVSLVALTSCQKVSPGGDNTPPQQKSFSSTCEPAPSTLLVPAKIYTEDPATFSYNRANVTWHFVDPMTQEDIFKDGSPLTITFQDAGVYNASVYGDNCGQAEGREFHFEVLPGPAPTTTTTTTSTTTTTLTLPPTTTSTTTTTTTTQPAPTTTTTSTTTTTLPPTTTTTLPPTTTTTTLPPTTTTTLPPTTTTTLPPTTTTTLPPTTTTTLPPTTTTTSTTTTSTTTSTTTTTTTTTMPLLPPTVSLTKTPTNPSAQSNATFEFRGDDNGSVVTKFICSVDGAAYAECTSSWIYASLKDGNHRFDVEAIGRTGLYSSPVTYYWMIDTQAPVLNLTKAPSNPSSSQSAHFEFTAYDSGVGLQSLECQLDGGAFTTCLTSIDYLSLLKGTHSFVLKGTDKLNHVTSVSYTWSVDYATAPPPIPNIETAKPFYTVVQSGFAYPWQVETGGCLHAESASPTYAVYPVCETASNLLANSRKYSVMYFDINQTALSSLNSTVLGEWIQTANQNYQGLGFQVAGYVSTDKSASQRNSIMAQRVLSSLQQIATQTSRPATVHISVAVRGVTQFSCSVNLKDLSSSQTCLNQTRSYPQEYSDLAFFIDQVSVSW